MAKLLSSKKIIYILCKYFGFKVIHQRGSHIKLQKKPRDRTITTIVPVYKEVARGTLKGLLKLGEVDEKDFWDKVKR